MATIAHSRRDLKYFHACVLLPHPAGYMCPSSTCDESFPPTTSVSMTLWLAGIRHIILPLIFIHVVIELNFMFWIWNIPLSHFLCILIHQQAYAKSKWMNQSWYRMFNFNHPISSRFQPPALQKHLGHPLASHIHQDPTDPCIIQNQCCVCKE